VLRNEDQGFKFLVYICLLTFYISLVHITVFKSSYMPRLFKNRSI